MKTVSPPKQMMSPPKHMIRFLENFCQPRLVEGIIGDLIEKFEQNEKNRGGTYARFAFYWQAIGFVRWRFKKESSIKNRMPMLWKNHLRTSSRSILQNKKYFFINLTGLVFAATCCLFCLILVHDELHYDNQHEDVSEIYRLYKQHLLPSEEIDHLTAETSGLMGPTMLDLYPEVELMSRMYPFDDVLIFKDDQNWSTDTWTFVDSSFLEIFSFELLEGDKDEVLVAPGSVVLTKTLSEAIFGNSSAIGERITGFGGIEYTVTGIVQDPPRQSSLQFDLLASWSTTVPGSGSVPMSFLNNWLAQATRTYVRLAPNAQVSKLEEKLPQMMAASFPERADQYFLFLQPFQDLHLYSTDIRYQFGLKLGSIRFINILCISALLILLIVLVNYINLSLSRASDHLHEIGVRKVLGATRKQLLGRFVAETLVSCISASILGYIILLFILPYLNAVSGKDLPLNALMDPIVFIFMGGFTLGLTILVGLYPALVLSSPSIATILRGGRSSFSFSGRARKILLGAQYAIAILLLLCTINVIQQTSYLANKSLGFSEENLIVIDIDNEVGTHAAAFENALLNHPNIDKVSIGRSAVGSSNYSTTFIPEGRISELGTRVLMVDADFLGTYGIALSKGRNFHANSSADSLSVIVNQAMVAAAGWENPIGKRLKQENYLEGYPIIGVVNDFHYHSLATSHIEPVAIFFSMNDDRQASIRLGAGDFVETMSYVEERWSEFSTRTPFNFYRVDEWFRDQYKTEQQLVKTSSLYALISILLSALGLYGLTSLLLQQKVKEISIRKVLGANLMTIVQWLSQEFLIIICLSFLVAIPIGYYLINLWLADFAYRIEPSKISFLITVATILLFSTIIIVMLANSATKVNPSKHLHD